MYNLEERGLSLQMHTERKVKGRVFLEVNDEKARFPHVKYLLLEINGKEGAKHPYRRIPNNIYRYSSPGRGNLILLSGWSVSWT